MSTDLSTRFLAFSQEQTVAGRPLLQSDDKILVGVSGGLDSMVLLDVLHRAGFALVVAHVNYGLRGAASDADQALVEAQCAAYDLPCVVHHVAAPPTDQAEAREVRYAFFEEMARLHACTKGAVAHHRDDQVETVLLNGLRGSGPRGLSGMPVARPLHYDSPIWLVRPLLFARRVELRAHAEAHAIPWREDASNQSLKYRRNVLRHRVLPLLREQFGPDVDDHIAASAGTLRMWYDAVIQPQIQRDWATAQQQTDPLTLRIDILQQWPLMRQTALLAEILRTAFPHVRRSRVILHQMTELMQKQTGQKMRLPGLTVWRNRDVLVFIEAEEPQASTPISIMPGEPVALPTKTVQITPYQNVINWPSKPQNVEFVDADCCVMPLCLRPWQAGDVFHPLGFPHRKKVSDFLTDSKIPTHERKNVWVLESAEKIIWIVGLRLADDVRITEQTTRVWRLSVESV